MLFKKKELYMLMIYNILNINISFKIIKINLHDIYYTKHLGNAKHLEKASVVWICNKCESMNFDSDFFHSSYIITSNYYAALADLSQESINSPRLVT